MVVTGPRDEGVGADQQLLARSLGALIGVPRFDSPIHLARAVHGATLALSIYTEALPARDGDRVRELRRQSLQVALDDDLRGISETDRDWLIGIMRAVLGKAGAIVLAEDRLH
jgi:hypothetical protein